MMKVGSRVHCTDVFRVHCTNVFPKFEFGGSKFKVTRGRKTKKCGMFFRNGPRGEVVSSAIFTPVGKPVHAV